jgi:dihydroorotate dehydrogenase electron transfer subunit
MADHKYQMKAKILCNIHISSNYYRLIFIAPEIAQASQPGQFVMLRISDDYQPLLRRPFSIHRLVYDSKISISSHKKNPKAIGIEILYEIVGRGTKILSEKKPGEYLDVLGPLGNGFDCQTPITDKQLPIIVAGGIGVAPLFFLAQRLTEYKLPRHAGHRAIVLIGARTKRKILCKKMFASLSMDVKISSDDGSIGFKGRVTGLLKNILLSAQICSYKCAMIYACGPRTMLREIAIISKQYGIPAQASLDEYMACGLGVCLGCMIQTKEGHKLVCKDGPVFDISEVKW